MSTQSTQTVSFRILSTSAFILSMALPLTALIQPAHSVEFPNGETAFNSPPVLVNASPSFNQRSVASTYYFTITVPENAGEPLQALRIQQVENAEVIDFVVQESRAFHGTQRALGAAIPLASVGGEAPAPGEATLVFDQPVAPGSTITIALHAKRNPTYGGVYLFGVTAFPKGERGRGQFLGVSRLHFYTGS
jgi:hypothetical protein